MYRILTGAFVHITLSVAGVAAVARKSSELRMVALSDPQFFSSSASRVTLLPNTPFQPNSVNCWELGEIVKYISDIYIYILP